MNPIIIIGAPRSGTKMIRELIKFHPQVGGALHEEERVWCYGNEHRNSQSLTKKDATNEIKKYIRNYYKNKQLKSGRKNIVIKNVANSLRIGFVKEVFPESFIINIIRDGREASYSAEKRWQEPLDIKYLIKNKIIKEKNFPIKEIPYFFKRYLKWAIQKKKQKKKHLHWWGPKFDDFEDLVRENSLIELCGIQWSRCVEITLEELALCDSKSYLNIRYEDLIFNTADKMEEVFDAAGLNKYKQIREISKDYVSTSSLGKWEKNMSEKKHQQLMAKIDETMKKLGYL